MSPSVMAAASPCCMTFGSISRVPISGRKKRISRVVPGRLPPDLPSPALEKSIWEQAMMMRKLFSDFWEWDSASNTWTKKADFPGGNRTDETCFTIGNKGYIATGSLGGTPNFNDLW